MSLEETAMEAEGEEFVDELKPGTKLMHGQYTIEEFLAAGGFGITYLARDSLNRQVVIKECFPGSFCRRHNHSVTPRSRAHQNELKSIVKLFSQEAMALAKTNHPNIVGVHLVFEENNTAYMALDYVTGRDLLEILQDDPESLHPELVEGYLRKVLDAIKHIHNLDMLHRDISPDNIIVNDEGEPILIDFGAARESSNEQVTRMLSALRVVKDGYSPQEFYIAGSDQPASCDLYSLAASFYHIITGDLPPDSQWRLSARAAGDEDPYVSLGQRTDAYSPAFVKSLDKAMATLPRERMQSAEEWLQYLDGTAPSVAITQPLADAIAIAGGGEKKSFLPILLGTTALAAAVGAGFFFMSTGDESQPAGAVNTTEDVAVVETPVSEPAPTAPVVATPEPVETVVATPAPVEPAIETPAPAETVVETPGPTVPTSVATIGENNITPDNDGSDVVIAQEAPLSEAEEPLVISNADPVIAPEDLVPDLPAVTDVAIEVADLPTPAVEETTDFVVPPILTRLPDQITAPLPRPFREGSVDVAALTEVQPVLDTVAPAAPAPLAVVEPEPVVVTEAEPVVVSEPEPAVVAEAEPEPIVVSEPEPVEVAAAEEPTSTGVDFFVNMAKEQPDIVSAPTNSFGTSPTDNSTVATPRVASATTEQASAPVETAPAATPSSVATPSSAIVSSFAPVIPFELSFWQPGLVVAVDEGAPAWLGGNARIVSINGQPVETNDQIVELISATASQDDTSGYDVLVGVESALTGAISEETLSIAKEQQIVLANGMSLVARETDTGWVTQVLETSGVSNFQPGDILVAYASTMESLDGPNSLQSVLETELANGNSSFSFAVNRDGALLVEAINLAALGN